VPANGYVGRRFGYVAPAADPTKVEKAGAKAETDAAKAAITTKVP
jgi:hypothetical protein